MSIHFSGRWSISVTSSLAPGTSFGSYKRFVVTGAKSGSGIYDGEPGAIGSTVVVSGSSWWLTPENQNPFQGNAWVPSPVQVTQTPSLVVIGINDDNSGSSGPYDDLVLTCCHLGVELPEIPYFAQSTWVSYGVMVDAGGPTGHGPVGPMDRYLKELAAGLALGDASKLVSPELRGAVAELAAKQVTLASTGLAKTMVNAKEE